MRVMLDMNEEALAEPARELWHISQDDADCDDPGELIEAVREIVTHLEEWLSAARVKAERWLS